jgi:hypothetical protein
LHTWKKLQATRLICQLAFSYVNFATLIISFTTW